jgi:thiol:disulfide interchange protein DsbC
LIAGAGLALCLASSGHAQAPANSTSSGAAPIVSSDPAVQTIKARLSQRLSGLPRIDEISPSGMPGLYEVRLGSELYYSDAQGNYLIRGELIDTRSQRNITRERLDKLSAIDFDKLPLKDAVLWKSGTGQRRIAVFADPNCPYCKKLESELQNLKDVSVYTFLYPILAPDSTTKSQAIWCNADASRSWKQWMLNGAAPADAAPCNNPIERNLALGKAHRIDGVPAVIFEDGSRSPGLVSAAQMELRMAARGMR